MLTNNKISAILKQMCKTFISRTMKFNFKFKIRKPQPLLGCPDIFVEVLSKDWITKLCQASKYDELTGCKDCQLSQIKYQA